METLFNILTYINLCLKNIVNTICNNPVDYFIITLSIAIMLDDIDTLRAMVSVKRKKINNKVEERNEFFEAITTTKGHTSEIICKRYLIVMLVGFIIVFINEHYLQGNIVNQVLSICALIIVIVVKHKCNKIYEQLKREKR